MEFKVGDKVVIDNLERFDDDPGVVAEMLRYVGMEGRIVEIPFNEGGWHLLDIDNRSFSWDERWLILKEEKGINKKKKKPKIIKKTKAALNKKIAEARTKLRKEATSGSCCSYIVIYDGGDKGYVRQNQVNDVCHARMGVYGNPEIAALIDYIGKPKLRFPKRGQYKQYLRFADFIINRSWVKNAFIPTTVQNYIRNGVRMNIEVSSEEVFAGLVTLRQGSERKDRILPMFCALVDKGYSEHLAFVLAMSFQQNGLNFSVNVPYGHSPLAGSLPAATLLEIAKGTYKFPKGTPYKKRGDEWNLFNLLCGHRQGKSWDKFLLDLAIEVVGYGDIWGKKVPNPITKADFFKIADRLVEILDKEVK